MYTNEKIYKSALDNAVASVEMEGYNITKEQKDICYEFVSGKIDKDSFIKTLLERCNV